MWPCGEPSYWILKGRLPMIFHGGKESFPWFAAAEAVLLVHKRWGSVASLMQYVCLGFVERCRCYGARCSAPRWDCVSPWVTCLNVSVGYSDGAFYIWCWSQSHTHRGHCILLVSSVPSCLWLTKSKLEIFFSWKPTNLMCQYTTLLMQLRSTWHTTGKQLNLSCHWVEQPLQ
jgi:hypothetical protein